MEQQPRPTLDGQSAAGPQAPPRPRGPAPAAQRSLLPAATGIGVSSAGLEPSPTLFAAVRPRLCDPASCGSCGSCGPWLPAYPVPDPSEAPAAGACITLLLSKKADSIPSSLAIDGVVVAVAVGGGRELLAGRARRALPLHVVPARTAVHSLAVRRGAHVGLGRLRGLAHYAAPTYQAAQKRAQAVQSVHQVGALFGERWVEREGLSGALGSS